MHTGLHRQARAMNCRVCRATSCPGPCHASFSVCGVRRTSECARRHGHAHHGRWIGRAGTSKDYYEVLGVEEDAPREEIVRKFRSAARRLHPDVNPDPQAAEAFMTVLEAYQALTDAVSREAYDREAGVASARAKDPRFARFERWRREVIPLLQVNLDEWSQAVDVMVRDWVASLQVVDKECQEYWALLKPPSKPPPEQRAALVAALAERVQHLSQGVRDGGPRMAAYVEQRSEQVYAWYSAYPELVYQSVLEEATEDWQARMDKALRPWETTVREWQGALRSVQGGWASGGAAGGSPGG